MKTGKKLLGILLAVLMAFSVLVVAASAVTEDVAGNNKTLVTVYDGEKILNYDRDTGVYSSDAYFETKYASTIGNVYEAKVKNAKPADKEGYTFVGWGLVTALAGLPEIPATSTTEASPEIPAYTGGKLFAELDARQKAIKLLSVERWKLNAEEDDGYAKDANGNRIAITIDDTWLSNNTLVADDYTFAGNRIAFEAVYVENKYQTRVGWVATDTDHPDENVLGTATSPTDYPLSTINFPVDGKATDATVTQPTIPAGTYFNGIAIDGTKVADLIYANYARAQYNVNLGAAAKIKTMAAGTAPDEDGEGQVGDAYTAGVSVFGSPYTFAAKYFKVIPVKIDLVYGANPTTITAQDADGKNASSVDIIYKQKGGYQLKTDNYGPIQWSSSDTKYVEVDGNGVLTTPTQWVSLKQKDNAATITGYAVDLDKSFTVNVNIKLDWWQWLIVIPLFGWIWY